MAQGISIPVVQSGLEASIQQGARNVGTININASVDPSSFKNLAQPLGRVSGLATEFEKSIAASNARVLAFGASVGIINGVQNAFSALVTTGIEVQKTLADIAAISGRSGAELSKFGDSLFEIGKITGQTFQTASQAALEFSRQGLSVEQTLKRTSDALTLTRFTTLSASEAVDVLTAAANSFSETGITTAQIINKLVAVDTKFAVSAEDLAKGLARAGSIAQEVGVNFDQLNAAVTVAQERTARGGAVIGNALKTIFTRLRSDETVQALRNIGVESLDAQGQLKGAIPLLEELSKKLQGLSGGERVQILEAVASKYNINILSALLNDLNDANSKFGQAVQISAGAGNQAYERQIELNKTLAAQLNNATVSATQLLNKLSEIGVTQNLNSLLSFVNDLLSGFNKLLDSGSVGGDIAKGLIKGISDVFFTVGLPILAAIFIKLTTDIAKFGVESLKTILGINQQVRERQALEQAVVNTLIRDQEVMASILALSGNRAKQEEYLLGVYNRQLTALQQVQSIASSVTPGLMAGGLSATSGQVKKRGAGGYLPSQEAADVRRGVGGASSSSKVVSIPNFAFGGGKRGTMVANTSEYVVPNFANGGSAIFNQDMARAYGLPAGAKKISAAGGYVPNFNRYVYDSDRIEPDKNSLLKAILASKAKKNLIVGPAGSGKSTYGASLGSFITNPNQLADATEIDVLSGAARTKDGGTSKNFQQIADAVNSSGGKISYLYAGNMDILSRRRGRIGTGPDEGDLRSKKQIAGSMYAPLNQFDFISKVKSSAKNFEMIRGAKGYVPNFAGEIVNKDELYNKDGLYAGLFAQETLKNAPEEIIAIDRKTERTSSNLNKQEGKDKVNVKVLSFPAKSNARFGEVDSIKKEIEQEGQNFAIRYATQFAKAFNPDAKLNIEAIKEKAKQANVNKGAVQAFVGTTFEAGVSGILNGEDFKKSQERSATSPFDFQATAEIRKAFNIPESVNFIETKNEDNISNKKSIAEKIYRIEKSKGTENELSPLKDRSFDYLDDASLANGKRKARAYVGKKDGLLYVEKQLNKFEATSERPTVSEINDRNLQFGSKKYERTPARSAFGYIPNFAQGSPLEDAIQREMAAGLDPSQIRVTKDGRLKNSQNPNGFAVINTRDEPNGKIPNFAANEDKRRKEILGKGTAYGPLLPQGYQIPQDTGNYGVGSSGYPQPIGPQLPTMAGPSAPESKSAKQFELTSGKLLTTFVGLQIATSTLQSTFKNTDSAVGKALTAFSQIGGSAAGYGAIGGMAGESLKGKGGILGKAAGYLGPAGVAIGAGVGIYQILDEMMSAPRIEREAQAKKKTENLAATGIDSRDQFSILKQDQARIETRRKELESGKVDRDQRQADRLKKSGPYGVGAALPMTEQEKKEELEILALEAERVKNQEKLREIKAQIILSDLRQIREEQKAAKDLSERIALTTQINALNEASAIGENKATEDRAKKQSDFIRNSFRLNEIQKKAIEDEFRLVELDEKRNDLRKSTLLSAASDLSKAKLGTVDKTAVNDLIKRLKAGEDIKNIEEEIAKLNIQDNSEAKLLIENLMSQWRQKNGILETEKKTTIERQDALRFSEKEIKLMEMYQRSLDDALSARRSLAEVGVSGTRTLEEATLRTPISKLQNEIATQPFATREQEYDLAKLTANFEKLSAQRKIQDDLSDANTRSFTEFQNSVISSANSLSLLDSDFAKTQQSSAKNATSIKDLTNVLDELKSKRNYLQFSGQEEAYEQNENAISNAEDALKKYNITTEQASALAKELNKQIQENVTSQLKLLELRKENPLKAGISSALNEVEKESYSFSETFGKNTTLAFRDGMRDALSAAISQTDDLGSALQNVAMGFLKTMQSQFLNQAAGNITMAIGKGLGMAKGGVVSGGSGYRDDVPAMLTSGEFVMRKSAVQKYGAANLERMNSGGMFIPGTRGGGAISGENDLRAFANQSTTSGATDALKGSRSSAFINLEDESQKLSRYALLGDDTINQEVRDAKMQAFDILKNKSDFEKQQKEAEKQQKKALVRQMIGTVAGAALSYGAGKLNPQVGAGQGKYVPGSNMLSPVKVTGAYGGMIRRYASGGPTDDIPAMLMSGEYVMNRGASRKYGKQFLDSMNQGRAPRFADGGEAAPSSPTTTTESNAKGMGDVSININVTGQTSQTETQGNSSQGGVDYKKMSEKIKMVVMETLNEEKRLGGSLRTR